MHWLWLMAAIVLEVGGTTSMKLAEGFTRPLPSVMIFVFYGLSFVALTFAIRQIDLAVAYAIWSGLGTALIAMIAMYWFGEAMTGLKVVSLLMIIAGVVGLRIA